MKSVAVLCGLHVGALAQITLSPTEDPGNSTTPTIAIIPPTSPYDSQVVLGCVVIVVMYALFFDFSNGFHDTANSVATCIGTRSFYLPRWFTNLKYFQKAAPEGADREKLRTLLTVIFAAVFNFLPAFVAPPSVANAISKVIAIKNFPQGHFVPLGVVCTYSTLLAAIGWNFLTWSFGFPSSSSHALIGALVGSGLAIDGVAGITWSQLTSIVYGLLGSPVYSGVVAILFMWALNYSIIFWVRWRQRGEIDKNHAVFRFLIVVSTAGLSWLHGTNDAQKTMGVIGATLAAAGYTTEVKGTDPIPDWVRFVCNLAIALGTVFGGWSIIGRMAMDIYPKMQRTAALCANAGAITSLETATALGLPVSTTHAMNFGILLAGVGDGGVHAVGWRVLGNMLICWVCTIPVTMFGGFALASLMIQPGGWGPFFCIIFGIALVAIMVFCGWKQKRGRVEATNKILEKYAVNVDVNKEYFPMDAQGHVKDRAETIDAPPVARLAAESAASNPDGGSGTSNPEPAAGHPESSPVAQSDSNSSEAANSAVSNASSSQRVSPAGAEVSVEVSS